MTVPSTGAVVDAPDLEAALAVMRERGMRVSAVRRLMLDALYAGDEPVTAEQLARRIGGADGADVASVYRNLETLEDVGLVRHFHLGHSPGLYVRAGAGAREYLVCRACQAVRSVDPAEMHVVRLAVRERFGWEAHFSHDPIVGLCPSCATSRSYAGGDPIQGDAMSEHPHEEPHAHEHEHDGETHVHAHTDHDHDHVEHAHQHEHDDGTVHSHPHPHEEGLEHDHTHAH